MGGFCHRAGTADSCANSYGVQGGDLGEPRATTNGERVSTSAFAPTRRQVSDTREALEDGPRPTLPEPFWRAVEEIVASRARSLQ